MAVVVALPASCSSKVPVDDPVSSVRDAALEKACTAALTVRDLIATINSRNVITPELATQLRGRVTPFADAARATKNTDLRAASRRAGVQADVLADLTRPEAERSAAYHPLIRAMAQAFDVCRAVGVTMPGDSPTTGGMDGTAGM